jgi:hypothetical protein
MLADDSLEFARGRATFEARLAGGVAVTPLGIGLEFSLASGPVAERGVESTTSARAHHDDRARSTADSNR